MERPKYKGLGDYIYYFLKFFHIKLQRCNCNKRRERLNRLYKTKAQKKYEKKMGELYPEL